MHILLALNAFKNSLDATNVAKALGKGLKESKLNCTLDYFPIGDGGDGTASLILKKFNGKIIKVKVDDPLGGKIKSHFGVIEKNKTAVIELADASGIKLIKHANLDPLHATTYGTGELIKCALDKGANKIILCIGGSATIDGGTGILQALGIQFVDKKNKKLKTLPASLVNLAAIDVTGLDKRILDCEIIILCDVENTLLGTNGAANIFGPQKGATPKIVAVLEKGLTKFCNTTMATFGKDMSEIKHGGASGGVAAGLATFLNARIVNGIDYFLKITAFDAALEKADLVITGEGSIDEQTLNGKGPFGVALKTKEKNIPVIGIAGKLPGTISDELKNYFDVLISINSEPYKMKHAIKNTRYNLIRTGKIIGDLLALQKTKMPG
ncbi:MAG: glycerate kinase [Ginsengibacter sp.]